jgi:hypothetical protein
LGQIVPGVAGVQLELDASPHVNLVEVLQDVAFGVERPRNKTLLMALA